MISVHSHSGQYCGHGHGTVRESVRRAVELGFTVFGLSEHMSRSRMQDLYPEESHLSPQALDALFYAYYVEAKTIQTEQTSMLVLVGAEIEWIHQKSQVEYEELRMRYALDYAIGSVHHVLEVPIDYSPELYQKALLKAGSMDKLYRLYFEAQYECLKSGVEVVGHFDLIRMYSPLHLLNDCWPLILRNIDLCVERGLLVEINSRGLKKHGEFYPCLQICKIMLQKGVRFTLSDDSHGPKDVAMFYDKLKDYLDLIGIKEVYYPTSEKSMKVNEMKWN